MGDSIRRVLCGPRSTQAPLSVPARVRVLPSPVLAPPPPAWPAGEPGAAIRREVDEIVSRLRTMDAPVVPCESPSCPRPPVPRGAYCAICGSGLSSRTRAQETAQLLAAAGWEPVSQGGYRRGWRDPATQRVMSARKALETVRRDALRDRASERKGGRS